MTKKLGENNKTRIVRMFVPYVSKSAVERVSNTLQSGYIGEGPGVAEFEKGFNTYIGTRYSLALSSCTAALHLALALCNVGPGDEVITTAQTMAATSYAVLAHYAKPVYTDIQYLKSQISIPVHNMLTDKDVDHVIRSIKGGW